MQKKRIYKDIHYRTNYKKVETNSKFLKYIMFCRHLEQNQLYKEIKKIMYKRFFKTMKQNSSSKIKNLCLISKRPNSVYRDFRLNRTQIKYFTSRGLLPGVRRGS